MPTTKVKKYMTQKSTRWDPVVIGLENQKMKNPIDLHINNKETNQIPNFIYKISNLTKTTFNILKS